MRAKKIDANQNAIVKSLRQLPGISVFITSMVGDGFVDVVVGYKSANYLVELKDENKIPSKRRLTPDEIQFHTNWKGQCGVCNNLQEVLQMIGFR